MRQKFSLSEDDQSQITKSKKVDKSIDEVVKELELLNAKLDKSAIREEQQTFLAKAGKLLTSSLNYKQTLKNVAKLAVPKMGDWCSVDLLDKGKIKRIVTQHVDPAKVKWAKELQKKYPPKEDSGPAIVIRSGQSMLISKVTQEMLEASVENEEQMQIVRELNICSAMIVPLIAREKVLGTISFVSTNEDHLYNDQDLKFAEELALRAAIAIDNANLYKAAEDEITERKKYEKELLETRANYQDLYDNAPDGYHSTNQDGMILTVNKTESKMLGYSADEMIGKTFKNFLSKSSHRAFDIHMRKLKIKGESKAEFEAIKSDGTVFPVFVSSSVKKFGNELFESRSILTDISQRKEIEAKVHNLAFYDSLTKLPNRLLLSERLSFALKSAKQKACKVGILFIDLDRFKNINDSLGHRAGDLVLIEVSKRIRSCLRETDTVSRQGGDEFTIVLQDIDGKEDASFVADKIIKVLSEPFEIEGNEIFISPSIGISIYPDDSEKIDQLIMFADMAMYLSKKQLGNTYYFYNSEMQSLYKENLEIEKSLRKSIAKNELCLFYQPKLNFKTNNVDGMEALVRWNHHTLGVISPSKFIPIAEETGLISQIGEWVLKKACEQTKIWHDEGYKNLKISVNVSIHQLKKGFDEILKRVLKETKLEPKHLELEITESIIMQDRNDLIKILSGLKKLGVSISIDDFGTGYSSLSRIASLPIDALKIDKSFVDKINNDTNNEAVIKAIIAIARSLGLSVIAEGVEKKHEMNFLCKEGCDEVQGYYVSPPVEAEKFIEVIGKYR